VVSRKTIGLHRIGSDRLPQRLRWFLQLPRCKVLHLCNTRSLFIVSLTRKPALLAVSCAILYLFWRRKTFRYSIPSESFVVPTRTRTILVVSHTIPQLLVSRKYAYLSLFIRSHSLYCIETVLLATIPLQSIGFRSFLHLSNFVLRCVSTSDVRNLNV
jgi:hypothetical protein